VTRRSTATREPRPRNRGASQRPRIVASIESPIEASTDRRAGERCCLQRLADGTTRIVLLDKSSAAYPVDFGGIIDGLATLLYVGEGRDFDDYVVPAAKWAALEAAQHEAEIAAAGVTIRTRRAKSALETMVREAASSDELRQAAREGLKEVVSRATRLAEAL
jgi:hypothetical protein